MKKLRMFDSLKFVRFVIAVVVATLILNIAHADNMWKYTPIPIRYYANDSLVELTESDENFNTYTVKASSGSNRCLYVNTENSLPANHKYFINVRFKSTFTGKPYFRYSLDGNTTFRNIGYNNNCQPNTWCNLSAIITPQQDWSFTDVLNGIVLQSGSYTAGETITIDKNGFVTVFDLTEIFGAGNEPATVADAERALSIDTTIKIATTRYSEEQFEPVQNRLSAAVNAVEDVVAQTMSQAQAIDQIANNKQTRPNEGCTAKYCLLVEDEDGTPHWYPIAGANGVAHNLPAGYTELQYLQGSGTQNITTDLTGFDTGNWEIYTKFMSTSETQTSYGYIVSVYNGESTNTYRVIFSGTNGQRFLLSGNNKAGAGNITVVGEVNRVYEATVKNGSVVFDGVTYETPTQGTALANNIPLTILGGVNGNPRAKARIYSVKATQDGVLRADYIPAKRNSDNALGLYDMVSGQFFGNAGTGDFTGPEM